MSFAKVFTGVDSVGTQFFFDTEQLVELSKTLGAARGASLDLACAKANDEVSNGRVFGLTRAVRDHDAPSGSLRVQSRLDTFGDGADLVDLEQQGVACLLFDGRRDTLRVRDRQVVTHQLKVRGRKKMAPVVPVVLVKGVLDRHDFCARHDEPLRSVPHTKPDFPYLLGYFSANDL